MEYAVAAVEVRLSDVEAERLESGYQPHPIADIG